MTVLGKILVFVILVLAVVQAGLYIMFHIAQTHWKAGYDQAMAQYQVARAEADTWRVEKEKAEAERDARVKELSDKLNDRDKQVTDTQSKFNLLETQRKGEESKADTANNSLLGSTSETKQLHEEVKLLQVANQEKDKTIARVLQEKGEMRDRAVAAEIKMNTLLARVEQMEGQLEDLNKQL